MRVLGGRGEPNRSSTSRRAPTARRRLCVFIAVSALTLGGGASQALAQPLSLPGDSLSVELSLSQPPLSNPIQVLLQTPPDPDSPAPPPPPDPDPIPPPPPPPPPAETTPPPPPPVTTPSVSVTPSSPASKPKEKKKKVRTHERPTATEQSVPRISHEPRDPPVVISTGSKTEAVGVSLARSLQTSSSRSNRWMRAAFLVVGIGLGGLLLGLAALPSWVLRPARASLLVEQWRVQIAATGLSALCMAVIVFLLGTSRI